MSKIVNFFLWLYCELWCGHLWQYTANDPINLRDLTLKLDTLDCQYCGVNYARSKQMVFSAPWVEHKVFTQIPSFNPSQKPLVQIEPLNKNSA